MLEQRHIRRIREELDSSKRPIFFFHDDADGLCSFLLFYRHLNEGKGIIIKKTPKIDSATYTRKVKEYEPDKVFILDIAMVEQDFLDDMAAIGIKVVWIDHHNPLQREDVMYFNPRVRDPKDSTCVTRLCYEVVKKDIWIAMVGSIGDWQMPDFKKEFVEKYPDLLAESVEKPEEALFAQPIGELVMVFNFILKGKTQNVIKCMKILTRIDDPHDILDQRTPKGKFIYKRHENIKEHYDVLIKKAKDSIKKDRLFVFRYQGEKFSFSSELSNEMLYLYPTKIILLGREKSGEVKMSIRSTDTIIPPVLSKALDGVEGFGGGHEHACGAVIKKKDFKKFISQFKAALKSLGGLSDN